MSDQDGPKMDEAEFDSEAQRLTLTQVKRKLEAEIKRRAEQGNLLSTPPG